MSRIAVRSAAAAALAAAVAVPLVRRRVGISPAATTVALAGGPLALAVLKPRSKGRDAALFALQMWGFMQAHELPYDNPAGLERRLKVRYPIVADRFLGAGELPNLRLQRSLSRPGEVTALDRALSIVHWAWFMEPHISLLWVQRRHVERFPRAARQMAATYDLGCLVYFAVPTAPPWYASEIGATGGEIRRVMVDAGEELWGKRAWARLDQAFNTNPWAAMPSLHFATSVMAAIHLAEIGVLPGALGWGYALTLGFALVYLGEHYVTDLLAGAALVALVRRGEPIAEPLVEAGNRVLRRLEAIAAGS